jgi:hypothetical protein
MTSRRPPFLLAAPGRFTAPLLALPVFAGTLLTF